MDSSEFATKTGIKDLKLDIRAARREILKVEERTENLEEGQQRIETKLDKLQNTLDKFVGRVDDLSTDNEVGTHQTRELRLQVDNHEERLKIIESSRQIV